MKSVRVFATCVSTVVLGIAFGCTDTAGGKSAAPEPVAEGTQGQSTLTPAQQVQQKCAGSYANPGQCNGCVRSAVRELVARGEIPRNQGALIIASFASGACRNACIPLTCAIAPRPGCAVDDLCGGTLACTTCPPGEVCSSGIIGGACVAVCTFGIVGTGPNSIVCQCDGLAFNACGSCDSAAATCDAVCGVSGAPGSVLSCTATTSCGTVPAPPPSGPSLVACTCDGNPRPSTFCAEGTAACDDFCAACGGTSGSFVETNSPACPQTP